MEQSQGKLLQGSELTERRTPPPLGTTPKKSALKRSALQTAAPPAPSSGRKASLGGTISGPASAPASSDEMDQSEDVRVNRKLSWHDHHGEHPSPAVKSTAPSTCPCSHARLLPAARRTAPGLQLLQVHNVHDTHYQRGPCARWKPFLRATALFAGTLLLCFSITNALLRLSPNLFSAAGSVRNAFNSTSRAPQS